MNALPININPNSIGNQQTIYLIELMRMKNRFCRMGKALLGAACLLSTFGVTYSCSDDFDLDETKPNFLGASIYDELKNRQDRKFTTVIRLIDDLDYTEVMSRTGSKTLFVADDDAYRKFFETTTWTDGAGNPVRSYDQLSTAQKRILLNGSMLNNAFVLETLTTLEGPVKNLCLRQLSGMAATDTVPYFKWDDLPNNLSEGQTGADGKVTNADRRFWDKYRTQARGGIYMALDKTVPMMTHFLEAQMNEKKITHSDVSFILGHDGTDEEWSDNNTENRSYVYDARIVEGDVTCLNGYYHVLDKVLVTPMNMAEVIRTNGDTKYFSQMLDRFSAPYYDATLTEEYKALQDIAADSVYQKLYIAQRSQLGNITADPDGEPLGNFPSLSFDPGWNAYTVSGLTKEQDMAAMFVPSDNAIKEYFLTGGGKMLIERYGTRPNTEENLEFNLYQIPLNIIRPLVANLMKDSFNETVPSKYLTIMNDAQDQMFTAQQYPSIADYKRIFKKVMMANNGVVYVMDRVIGPATYSSVMAPALYNENAQVVNSIIHADDAYVATNFQNAPLQKYYSTYLLAMQSNFSLFVPTDDGLKKYGYVDPVGFASGQSGKLLYWTLEPQAVTQESNANNKYVAVRSRAYRFRLDQPLNAEGSTPVSGSRFDQTSNKTVTSDYGLTKRHILTELLDQHTIVHEQNAEGELGVNSGRKYFVSRSGAPVYVKNIGGQGGLGMVVDGGLQIALNEDEYADNDFDCKVTSSFDMSRATNEYGNGMTYFLDRPIQPTLYNVYQMMNQRVPEYNAFFNLCKDLTDAQELVELLFKPADYNDKDSEMKQAWENEQRKYEIFASSSSRPTANLTQLVRFFNNYRYTIYVPTAEALQKAYDNGLMTVEQIQEFVEANTDSETGEVNPDAKVKAQAMMLALANFVKYHFTDQSLYVDNCTANTVVQTSCTNQVTNNFINLTVKQTPNQLKVVDATNAEYTVQAPYNKLARDFELDNVPSNSYSIKSSSYVVLHSLNDYMRYGTEVKDRFDNAWATPAKAKAFVKKYSLKK